MRSYKLTLVTCLMALSSCTPEPDSLIEGKYVSIAPPRLEVSAGGVIEARIPVEIAKGYHIQANPASKRYLIPAKLTLHPPHEVVLGAVIYPEGKPYRLEGSDQILSVYDGKIDLTFQIEIPKAMSEAMQLITGEFLFQTCDHQTCYPPESLDFELEIHIL